MTLDPDLASEAFCYLTTTGRVTGRPHTIEIWFAVAGRSLYLMAGAREKSDWVRNLQRQPAVTVRVRDQSFAATARVVDGDATEDALARRLLLAKYASPTDDLVDWGREALPVAIDLPAV